MEHFLSFIMQKLFLWTPNIHWKLDIFRSLIFVELISRVDSKIAQSKFDSKKKKKKISVRITFQKYAISEETIAQSLRK